MSARRQPRYLVHPLAGLRIRLPQGADRHYVLATLGEGGFGIFCSHKDSKLMKLDAVNVEYDVGGKTLKAQGKIQYFKCLPKINPNLYFVGVKLKSEPVQKQEWKHLIDHARDRGFLAKPIH